MKAWDTESLRQRSATQGQPAGDDFYWRSVDPSDYGLVAPLTAVTGRISPMIRSVVLVLTLITMVLAPLSDSFRTDRSK
jgi:hypothetical protein